MTAPPRGRELPIDAHAKKNLMSGFTGIVRHSLVANVDFQSLSSVFEGAADKIEPKQPMELQTLFDFLVVEQKQTEEGAIELCLVLNARTRKLNQRFILPEQASAVGVDDVERIVSTFNARAADEEAKAALVQAFGLIVRQCQIPNIDVQRLAMIFRMNVDRTGLQAPIDLGPIAEFLIGEQKAPEAAVLDMCVILKSRETRVGATFTLPEKATALPAETVEKAVGAFNAKHGDPGFKKSSTLSGPVARPPIPPIPAPAPEPPPSKAKKGNKRPVALFAALGVVVLAAVGFFVWNAATTVEIVEIQVPTGEGLPCTKVIQATAQAVCTVPRATWEAWPAEPRKVKAANTLKALGARGVTELVVRLETGEVVLSLP